MFYLLNVFFILLGDVLYNLEDKQNLICVRVLLETNQMGVKKAYENKERLYFCV